ncbi:unnamed protein product [Brassicogethes aeneus]|uniref:Anaphase-promoting complex subunit 2 n=1 Tax=Brassicogethes aeneus TaxID=1431903 RepID=A0A9P0AST0_BRAAE|nr:unnamed protein product [Brassicogethes aeneus]
MNENNIDYKTAWVLIQKVFPILDDNTNINHLDGTATKNEFYEVTDVVVKLNISKLIQDFIIDKIEYRFRKEIAPEFWSYFGHKIDQNSTELKGFNQFYDAVNSLYHGYQYMARIVAKLDLFRQATQIGDFVYNESDTQSALQLICKSTLLFHLNLDYQSVIMNFYETALKIEDTDEINTEGQCFNCLHETQQCNCMYLFKETNRKLGELCLLEPLCGQTITNLIYNYIYSHIQKLCKDSFDSQFIGLLEKWLQEVAIKWLKTVYCFEPTNSFEKTLEILNIKLTNFLNNSYTKIRIEQLFNIIIEYPESLPALEDLKLCLPRTDLKPYLTKTLQRAMETRLLHPGVSTPDVLTAYVATIRSLRVLDPTGLLLETVTCPVHKYLRSREDTVRCVVSSLTEEGPNDLAEELVRGEAIRIDENTTMNEDEENWETWVPDPVDVVSTKPTGTRRTSDIISMLVNVYGSKELFVNEYRTILADRLLTQYTCDTEKEIRYLELLKLRFGDSHLHYCEVMLKDIADSKRINQNIKQDSEYSENEIPMSTMIVSSQFWPPFKEEKLMVHSKLKDQIEIYTTAFEKLKGSRTLCWKYHLGIVDLELKLADRSLNFSVSPIQATIIMHFQDKNVWELEELSKIMQCPATILRKKIGFWQSHGVIVEKQQDIFSIQEGLQPNENNIQEDLFVEDYESESAMASAQDQREEELQTFWSYIVGMLMNLETLPLDRIHQMLKMFAFQGPTLECSLQELKVFLDRKVREHQLIFSGGYYTLPK